MQYGNELPTSSHAETRTLCARRSSGLVGPTSGGDPKRARRADRRSTPPAPRRRESATAPQFKVYGTPLIADMAKPSLLRRHLRQPTTREHITAQRYQPTTKSSEESTRVHLRAGYEPRRPQDVRYPEARQPGKDERQCSPLPADTRSPCQTGRTGAVESSVPCGKPKRDYTTSELRSSQIVYQ